MNPPSPIAPSQVETPAGASLPFSQRNGMKLKPINYFKLIHRYIPPGSFVYRVYIPHVSLTTAKALKIARRLGLSHEQLIFIEEASMLHDIGIVRVKRYSFAPRVNLPYMCHAPAGREILEREGLPKHALVAERHIVVGISKEEIIANRYPLPPRDLIPESLEEKIISWADLFFSKTPDRLWFEKSLADVEQTVARYGERQLKVFHEWLAFFGSE
jgi:uncharacterized protein